MTATDPQSIAVQLHDWFESILRLTEESLFGVAPEGPHRDAVVLDTLKRNARDLLNQAELDNEGKLCLSTRCGPPLILSFGPLRYCNLAPL
jgi:hypothetical protein